MPTDKEKILKNISRLSAEQCIKYIEEGTVSFEEMQKTGNLQSGKQKEIKAYLHKTIAEQHLWNEAKSIATESAFRNYLDKYPEGKYSEEARSRIKNAAENQAWAESKAKNTRGAYEVFIIHFPHSLHIPEAKEKIEALKNAGKQEREEWMRKLKENPEDFTEKYIKDLIDQDHFSKQDLVDYGLLPAAKLDLFFNPPPMPDSYDWSDLAPLPKGKTDVYLFGVATSGKSSMLAGLFYRADELGILSDDIANDRGTHYKDLLIESVEKGHVFPRTQVDTVNYISCALIDLENNREHPLSIIEMSGEFFTNAYNEKHLESLNNVEGIPYLQNSNRKVIYLVIDYHEYVNSKREQQKAKLNFVLNLLDKDGTLAKTDSIHIIVTKTDLIASDSKEEHIRDFLNSNFLSLINQIKRFNKKYGINKNQDHEVIVHPYSLGKFYLGKVYDFDPTCSDNVILSILNSTASTQHKKSWKPW
ncbi:TRAFAC clade GTPase domain-containing protein [Portibacter lacus]|uniref:Double-GTPase 2 domain-containing protein n=1 Tax=Portibacter lacus TaxID=1099794 RepID=A0AA37WCC0_9BACT|nr:hypothetical protein [Portibacter lacus]GLR15883.1 hypothetical protein GCM10007940_04980 [Portibacter lacus]